MMKFSLYGIIGFVITLVLLSICTGESSLEYYQNHTMRFERRDDSCRPEDGFFRCDNSVCTERHQVRDINEDCEDGSDQRTVLNCTDGEFRCRYGWRCVARRLSVDGCKEETNVMIRCRDEEEFTCSTTRRCIPRWMVMDGKRDCDSLTLTDGSDEESSLPNCTSSEFRCQSQQDVNNITFAGRCIPREWVMDNNIDCLGSSSDEDKPFDACYTKTEFRCPSTGRCLLRYRVMDGFNDCPDKADEQRPLECKENEFRCMGTERCIPKHWLNDGERNCPDGSDEVIRNMTGVCAKDMFLCVNQRRCIPENMMCDGVDNCGDCSDEIESCSDPRMFRCPENKEKCLSWDYSCDAYTDCEGGKDDITSLPGFKCFRQVSSLKTHKKYCSIPQWSLRDSLPWCDDTSDVCFVDGVFVCSLCLDNRTIIAKRQICDGVIDCPDLSDECLCSANFNTTAQRTICSKLCYKHEGCGDCKTGQLACDNKCLPPHKVCDGSNDCALNGVDENFCALPTPVEPKSSPKNFSCFPIPETFRNIISLYNLTAIGKEAFQKNAVGCDGKVECFFFEDECSAEANCSVTPKVCDTIPLKKVWLTNFLMKFLSANGNETARKCGKKYEYVAGLSICNGVSECSRSEDEEDCERTRFSCDAGTAEWHQGPRPKVSVALLKVCDGVVDCVGDAKDEMNCSSKTHFYCNNGDPLFVSRSKVLDGITDCTDLSDECPEEFEATHAVSSKSDMIASPGLRIFVWISAFLALLGNSAVMVITCKYLYSVRHNKRVSTVAVINNILILNLALADFLMGVCLVIIGVKSVQFSSQYCLRDRLWRASGTCDSVGVMTTLSSEASVLTLICLTSYRLYGVFRPFKSREVRVRWVFVWLTMLWIFSLITSLLPLSPALSRQMVTEMLIPSNPYFQRGAVKFDELQRFALRLNALVPTNSSRDNVPDDWNALNSFLLNHFPSLAPKPLGYHGFYSASSVCIPKFFRLPGDGSIFGSYSAVVITFNFVALLYILASYLAIYRHSTRGNAVRSAKQTDNKAMQRKISFLIGTDFCCWMPICVMTFISMSGGFIPPYAYAFSAIILLPVNSALNPIIYSNTLPLVARFFVRLVRGSATKVRAVAKQPSTEEGLVRFRVTSST